MPDQLPAFRIFGSAHLLTLACFVILTALAIAIIRRNNESTLSRFILTTLITLNILAYPLNFLSAHLTGEASDISRLIPLHLCDISAIICAIALITRRPIFSELAFFWGLTGATQALLTPALDTHAFSFSYITFFLQHMAIVATALILPCALSWRPRKQAPLYAFLLLLLYAAILYPINSILGTNFGFIMHKPHSASLLDHLGPWPWYILSKAALAYALFSLLSIPFSKTKKTP